MTLCLLAFNVPRSWPLPRLIEVSRRLGFAALELRWEQLSWLPSPSADARTRTIQSAAWRG